MRKSDIKLALFELTSVKLLALVRNVIAKMTGNANFTTPPVTMAAMGTKADALEAAIEEATNGSRQSKLLRNDLVLETRDMLRTQADYVRSICLGDRTMLESSGFQLAKERAPIGIPGTADRMEAHMTGLKGEVELRWDSVYGAHGYQIWMTDQDPQVASSWQAIGYTTRRTHLVTDLESFKAFWFCVSAIGTAGEGAQSDPALGRAA